MDSIGTGRGRQGACAQKVASETLRFNGDGQNRETGERR